MAKKIQRQENKYRYEEIEKQKREQRERDQLLLAIDELKALSSQESILQFNAQAKIDSFWKENTRFLPFSFNNLPNFVNVDVPNGDWIFGCDRRIWQTAFYKYFFLWRQDKPFCIEYVEKWLQNTVKVHPSIKIVGIYGRKNLQILPDNIKNNLT